MGKHLSISRRLVLGFLVVVLAMVGLTGVGVWRVETVNSHLTTINDLNSVKQRYAINFRGSVHDRAIALRDVVLATTPVELEREVALIEELAAKYAASAGPMDEMFAVEGNVGAEEEAALAEIKRIGSETLPLVEQVVPLARAGDDAAALAVLTGQAFAAVAEGDLTRRLEVHRDDEIGRLAGSANTALESLGRLMATFH